MDTRELTFRGNSLVKTTLVTLFVTTTIAVTSREAAAEIPLVTANGWDVTLDGRFNTFLSFSHGTQQPNGVPTWAGGVEDRDAGTGTIQMTRVRSGFVQNVFGFSLIKQLSPNVKVTGRLATWVGVSAARSKTDNPSLDAREAYIKIEGPWGGVLAGRNLSLFERGAILMDYDIHHGSGLGFPCAVRTVSGGACGFAGHGLLFPSFNAGVVYNTPDLFGLQLSVGAYDPAAISERQYEITPYPRVEAELAYKLPGHFRLFADVLWQRVGNNVPLMDPQGASLGMQRADAVGAAAGASVTVGPLALGGAAYSGSGLGLYVPMENTPLFSDQKGILHKSQGAVGMASLTFGETKIAGGAGVSQLKMTATESEPFSSQVIPKQQLGISAGFYQGVSKTLTFALEYFRGQYQWYDLKPDDMSPVTHPRQTVNFVNAGITMIF